MIRDLHVAAGFSATSANNPPKYAYFSLPREPDAASGFEFPLASASGFPVDALSIPRLFDAIGWFTDGKLVETFEVMFIATGFDFATILFSSCCSMCLFANLLEEQVKLKFWAQQKEMKWLMLNNWRRLFHSSRVKLSLYKMSANWCLVSMYQFWILGSRITIKQPIQSNLVGSWHVSHCWTSASDYHLNHGLETRRTEMMRWLSGSEKR